MPPDAASEKGFTLVELAIVLVVLGLLIGLGVGMVGPMMNSIKVRESKDILGSAVESVNSWSSGNNRVPDTTTAAASPTLFSNVVKNPNDAWGRLFVYVYDSNLAPATATKDTICGRRATYISLTDTNTGAIISNVAYLIVSKGDDAVTNTKIGVTAVTTGALSAATTINADTANDLVRWVTLDELRTKVGCQGAQLKIVNNEVPTGSVASLYPTVAINVDGGATPGTLRWCVEAPIIAALPNGVGFTPLLTGAIRTPGTSCNGTTPLAEASWISSSTLTISGTPAAASQGSYFFTVYVRDNNDAAGPNDNVASKSFVMTINP